MKAKKLDYIDFEEVNTLLEGFNKTTGFVTAILDLEGNVLSKSGWRQICTEFHRINPDSSKNCSISDTVLANKLGKNEKYHFYECLNGMVDVAVPIVINGEHIANLFSGQFFFDKPDLEFFKKQAKKYGFNEKKYLKALQLVPVVSREKVKAAMDFLLNMTQLISEITLKKLEQSQLNEALRKSEERSAIPSTTCWKAVRLLVLT
ncbi:MAG: PocR ligand-binding domain-containing protein [Bacteroidales bacterium]|nr:PocR ligand-binding domain-containing protein [Bacteroidales bacterium]